jgi:hypothetical protein
VGRDGQVRWVAVTGAVIRVEITVVWVNRQRGRRNRWKKRCPSHRPFLDALRFFLAGGRVDLGSGSGGVVV